MKKLVYVAIVLLVLCAGVLGLALYNANALAKRYKPTLQKMASDALGSDVSLGPIGISLIPDLELAVDGVTITSKEDPSEKLELEKLGFQMKLLPLLRGRLDVTALSLDNPHVAAFIEEEGLRIAGLPRHRETAEPEAPPNEDEELPLELKFESVNVDNGTIVITDLATGTEYTLSSLDISTSIVPSPEEIVLSRIKGSVEALSAIKVAFEGSDLRHGATDATLHVGGLTVRTLGNEINVSGDVKPDDSSKKLKISSDGIDLASLGPLYDKFAPVVAEYGLAGAARPDMSFALAPGGYTASGTVSVSQVAADIAGVALTGLAGSVSVQADQHAQEISADKLEALLNDIPISADVLASLQGEEAKLTGTNVSAFSGTGETALATTLNDAAPFSADLSVTDMSIQELTAALMPELPMKLQGTLKQLDVDVKGELTEKLTSSVKGNVSFQIADGLLEQVNLAAAVLSAVDNIPFVRGALLDLVPERLRDQLERDYTLLKNVEAYFTVADETLTTEKAMIVRGELFDMTSEGTIGFDTEMNLACTISFNSEFSAALAESAKELTTLFDKQERLTFPIRITGTTENLSVVPDIKGLLKRGVGTTVKEEAGRLLDDLLRDKDEEEKKRPGEKLRNLLNR